MTFALRQGNGVKMLELSTFKLISASIAEFARKREKHPLKYSESAFIKSLIKNERSRTLRTRSSVPPLTSVQDRGLELSAFDASRYIMSGVPCIQAELPVVTDP